MANKKIGKLSTNALMLLIVQMANVLLPFVLAPYLTRVMGIESYGLIAFGLAFIQIAIVLVDYGFGISAVYKISINIDNKEEIRKIIGSVYICKILIFLATSVLIIAYPFLVSKYSSHYAYFWSLLLPIFFQSMQPVWLFHGLEKMKLIAIYAVVGRIILVVLSILMISKPDDLLRFSLINGFSQLVAMFLALYLMLKYGFYPKWSGWKHIKETFSESTGYFWSRLSVVIYSAGSSFYLGAFSSSVQVALYAVAEQFYRGAIAITTPISQALYPFMAKNRDIAFYKKVFYAMLVLTVIGAGFGYLIGDWLIHILFGEEYKDSYRIYTIFMMALLFAIPSIFLGYPLLGAMGDSRSANISVMFAAMIQLIGLVVLYVCSMESAFSVALVVMCAELTVLLYRIKTSRKFFR